MEYYFKTDDDLGRGKYARFLKSLILHSDDYRRDDIKGAYVIAIDSPWGTGKTRFTKMFFNLLDENNPDQKTQRKNDSIDRIGTIYYNSWHTDFSTNALEPLIYSILESPIFFVDKNERYEKQVFEDLWIIAGKLLKATGTELTRKYLGNTMADIVSSIFNGESTKKDPLEAYKNKLELLENFQNKLEEVINYKRIKKLVIIIDELDRCRPTFAIQTLEAAKHLFEVNNVVFLFALDIKQLSCSIKSIYGQEIDASGYLCRFFDYIGQFPHVDIKSMILTRLKQDKMRLLRKNDFNEEMVDTFEAIYSELELSLRDIVSLIKYYCILCDNFLQNYSNIEAHILYLILIAIKFKNPLWYNDLLVKKDLRILSDDNSLINRLIKTLNVWEPFMNIVENRDISNLVMPIFFSNEWDSKTESILIHRILIDVSKENRNRNVSIVYQKQSTIRHNSVIESTFSIGEKVSWGHILFYPDIVNWSQTKNFSLADFYHKQLEMVELG